MITILAILILLSIGIRSFIKSDTKIPFEISKITIVSTVNGENQESIDNEHIWNLNVIQNNDMYIDIYKNEGNEIIDKVIIDSFRLEKIPQKGEAYIYGPNKGIRLFENTEKNTVEDELTFISGEISDAQNLKVSDEGGLVMLRCSNKFVVNYTGDDNYVIHDGNLLKKSGITQEEIELTISFYLSIETKSGKRFRTKITLDLPNGDIIQNENTAKEVDGSEFIFKEYKK